MLGRETKAKLDAANARLAEIEPFAEIAESISLEIQTILNEKPWISPDELHRTARQRVIDMQLDEITAHLLNQYIDDNIDTLLDDAVDEIKATNGPELIEQAKQITENDPELRSALASKALAIAREEVMQEIQSDFAKSAAEIMDSEKERLRALNVFRLQLQRTTELSLKNPDIAKILEHGDKIQLLFNTPDGGQEYIEFDWYEDSASSLGGWVYSKSSILMKFINNNRFSDSLSQSHFIQINTLGRDLTAGSDLILRDILKIGLPICFFEIINDNPNRFYGPNYKWNGFEKKPELTGIKFVTREIKPDSI